MKHAVCATVLASLTLSSAPAQMACHDMSAMKHDMSGMEVVPAPDTLPPPQHMTGIGNSHITITAAPEAQVWFDQGLTLMHDFWDYESAKAFQQAIRVDPKCAMCYWGLSQELRNGDDETGSYSKIALDKAVELSHHASKKEQYIIAATKAEQAQGNKPPDPGHEAKKKAPSAMTLWQKAVDKDKNDPETKIFLAESMLDGYDDKGEPKEGMKKGIALLEEVKKQYPEDSAVNHYWIHAMEPGLHPDRAIDSAKKLASEAPASGHMVHMPGHIFYRVGDYAEAEHWFAASTEVDETYMRLNHVGVDDDWNYVHNLMYGIDNLMAEGKFKQATELSGKLSAARGKFSGTLYPYTPRDGMTRVNTLLPIALRTGDWKRVQSLLAESSPDAKLENLLFLSGELKNFARGMQAAEAGELVTARQASDGLDAALWRKSQAAEEKMKDAMKKDEAKKGDTKPKPQMMAVMPDALSEPLVQVLSIMSLELRASILASDKKLPEAKELFTQAAKKEKQLGYREPPMYIRPVGETEGATLLRVKDPKGAHEAYASTLIDHPNSGFAFYGIAHSSEAAGDTTKAHAEYQQFLAAWKNSDPGTPQLQHAEAYLAAPGKAVAENMPRP